jgi:pilus assembly protein CpaC
VKFAEVDRTKAAQLGFSLLSMGKAVAFTGTGQFNSLSAPSTIGDTLKSAIGSPQLLIYDQATKLGAAIQDMQDKSVLQILAEPTITALSGHTGTFLAGGEFPYPLVTSSSTGSAVSIQFMPYGVSLTFLPVVLADGTIRLHVAPEVSALDYTNEVVVAGTSEPAISTRRAETDIELRDGQTFALSGLLDKTITDQFQRMPGIASVPIIGMLFRSKGTSHANLELLVIVTPHIIDEVSHPDATPNDLAPVIPYMTNKSFDKGAEVKNKSDAK